jgi:RES domain-containing protein
VIGFDGTAFRALFAAADPLAPASAPEGRFHHSGQWALYASLTPEGCAVAIRRYLRPDDPPRVVVALRVTGRMVDLRGRTEASVVWQDGWAAGTPSPTWAFSDAARAAGAQGLLYSSRSRPDLAHLAIFDPAAVRRAADGAARAFPGAG